MSTMTANNYEKAGVNRAAGDRLVEKIQSLVGSTQNRRVKAGVGGYASLYEIKKNLWLAASTDGVGTKLKLAFELGKHDTVGIDLVAMSVNDLLCVGALPLFFLDYFACGKLDNAIAEQVIQGIVRGCQQANCALVGGETAEMPGFYTQGEYDLAGFAVGVLEPKSLLPRQGSKGIKDGDVLLGLPSSGFHSNGFSLIRSWQPDPQIMQKLLTPTRIYVSALAPLLKKGWIKGLSHITGSGLLNVPRMSEEVSYEIHMPAQHELPEVFSWARSVSGLADDELLQTFNMGIGMIMVVSAQHAAKTLSWLKKRGEKVWALGHVVAKKRRQPSQVMTFIESGKCVTLNY